MHFLFDLDGTLTDPFPGITRCIAHALERLDAPVPPAEELRGCIGPPLKQSLARLLATDDEDLVERALLLYRERFGRVGLYENAVCDGIPEVLAALNEAHHALYVATSKPAVYARRIIAHFDLRRHFDAVYGSELDGTRVDKTRLIAYILERESIQGTAAVMIGDRAHDMIGARANGLACIGVLWGYGSKNELEASGAHALIATPAELIPAVNGMSGFERTSEK